MPRRQPRRVAPLIGLLISSLTLTAQQQPADTTPADNQPANGPITTIYATTRLVVLDVVVNDSHAHPVKGLTASDFVLSEDGVPQSLASFTEHDTAVEAPPQEQQELPPNTFAVKPPVTGEGAVTVIVLGHLAFADAPFVRDQLKAYLKTASPAMPIAIFSMDTQGMRLVQGFTSDSKVLQEAASSKRILPGLGFAPMGDVVRHGTLQLSQYLNSIPGRVNVIWFSSGTGPAGLMGTSAGLTGAGSGDAFSDVTTFVNDLNGSRSVLRLSRVALYAVDANGLVGEDLGIGFGSGAFGPTAPDPSSMFNLADLDTLAKKTGGRAFFNNNGFKEVISQVIDSGSHFYTVSYHPTNNNWNGAYRRIQISVTQPPEPKYRWSLYDSLLGFTDYGPKLQYRPGYYARSIGTRPDSARSIAQAGFSAAPASSVSAMASPVSSSDAPRKLISVSPKGHPGIGLGDRDDPLTKAMAFAMPTPIGLPYRITVTPSAEVDRLRPGQPLPPDNFLSQYWRMTPYRNFKVHYSIDAKDMHLNADAPGRHRGKFQFVIMVYRDNGEPVNSISSTVTVNVSDAEYVKMLRNGMSFDQTVAIPTKINTNAAPVTANFFIRAAVDEVETGRIGVVEVPAEWVKVLPVKVAEEKHADHPSR
jgi:VWFA-related protein